MAFSFIHTADIHLDSPLKSLALRNPELADLVAHATRTTLSRVVDLCLAEQVQALLIAGDLYDGGQTSMKTAGFLVRELARLSAAGIATYVIRGNHDAASRITRELQMPDGVHVFAGRAGCEEVDWNGHPVAVHGISFNKPHAPDSLLDRFAAPKPGAFNIGLLHTSLGGSPGHDPYAPCTLTELQATGFEYWALGHIHKRAAHPGPTTVVMPGCPQGRDMGEAGEKTVTQVRVDDAGGVTLTAHALAAARFDRVEVPCQGIDGWGALVTALKSALSLDPPEGTQLILRPRLTGTTPLAWQAKRDAELLLGEAQSFAEGRDGLWIDKIEIALTSGDGPAATGPLGDLLEMLDQAPLSLDEGPLREEYDRLRKQLPPALKNLFGADEAETARTLAQAMAEGAEEVLALLAQDPAEDTAKDLGAAS